MPGPSGPSPRRGEAFRGFPRSQAPHCSPRGFSSLRPSVPVSWPVTGDPSNPATAELPDSQQATRRSGRAPPWGGAAGAHVPGPPARQAPPPPPPPARPDTERRGGASPAAATALGSRRPARSSAAARKRPGRRAPSCRWA